VANRIRTELIAPNQSLGAYQGEVAKLEKLAEFFDGLGIMSVDNLRKQKTAHGKITKWGSETVPAAFAGKVYGIFKTELEDVMGRIGNLDSAVSQKTGLSLDQILAKRLPGLAPEEAADLIQKTFIDANKAYESAITIEQMAKKRLGQTRSNRGVSLTDTIMAAGGVAGGGPVQGLALGALNNLGRKYGNTVQAIGADKLYQVLSKAPNQLGKFGAMLENAASKSPLALVTLHRSLMKNPDYQNILMNFEPKERGIRLPENKNDNKGISLPK
jgi:hypothetical protein